MADQNATSLSPIERVVTRLHDAGASPSEIGSRIGKKPGTVARILDMASFRTQADSPPRDDNDPLRPVERVVLRLRATGQGYSEIGNRLGRSGRQVREIERFARLKLTD